MKSHSEGDQYEAFNPHQHGVLADKHLLESVLDNCPEEINDLIDTLRNRDNFDEIDVPKKVILVGPPGTGKTTIAQAIASKCGMKCYMKLATDFANEYKDSGNSGITRFFEEAIRESQNQPCVIIIDELGALIKRHSNKNDSDSTMIMALWGQLDKFKHSNIFFIGTLNDFKKAPEPFKNRFYADIIKVPLPNDIQREKLLTYYMSQRKKVKFESIDKTKIIKKTKEFAHRNLEELVIKAVRSAKKRKSIVVTMQDFNQAIHLEKLARKEHVETIWEKIKKNPYKWGSLAIGAAGLGFAAYAFAKNHTLQKEALVVQKRGIQLQEAANVVNEANHILNSAQAKIQNAYSEKFVKLNESANQQNKQNYDLQAEMAELQRAQAKLSKITSTDQLETNKVSRTGTKIGTISNVLNILSSAGKFIGKITTIWG